MARKRFFGSLLTSLVFAAAAFFVIYFFVPSVSLKYFGFSWRGAQDSKEIRTAVEQILVDAKVPQVAIEQYLDIWDDPGFQRDLTAAAARGEDALMEFLASVGEGLDFSSFEAAELKDRLADGFSEFSSFTAKQLKVLQRLLPGRVVLP